MTAPAAPAAPATTAELAAHVAAGTPVLVDFWAPWCGPCRAVAPAVGELAAQLAGRVAVVTVNVDEEPEAARAFSVLSVPSLVLVDKGTEVGRLQARTVAAMRSELEGLLA